MTNHPLQIIAETDNLMMSMLNNLMSLDATKSQVTNSSLRRTIDDYISYQSGAIATIVANLKNPNIEKQ